jgi:hypothetical protein
MISTPALGGSPGKLRSLSFLNNLACPAAVLKRNS